MTNKTDQFETQRRGDAEGPEALSAWEADILLHTSTNGRFVTDEARVIALAGRGLLFDHGPQALAGGAHYLVTTAKGRAALGAWKAVQPRPVVRKVRRRRSEQFQTWREYRDACDHRISFPEFLRDVWPSYSRRFV